MATRAKYKVVNMTSPQAKLPVSEASSEFIPAYPILFSRLRQIDKYKLLKNEELDQITRQTGGYDRRSITKVLAGMYQRAIAQRNSVAAKWVRTAIVLHDYEQLDSYLKVTS